MNLGGAGEVRTGRASGPCKAPGILSAATGAGSGESVSRCPAATGACSVERRAGSVEGLGSDDAPAACRVAGIAMRAPSGEALDPLPAPRRPLDAARSGRRRGDAGALPRPLLTT